MTREVRYQLTEEEVAKILAQHFGISDPQPKLNVYPNEDRFGNPTDYRIVLTAKENDAQAHPQ
jgi:hypothetical protein